MSTGREELEFSPAGRVRVRSSGSGAEAGEPAPGMRAPKPRPSPRFCVMPMSFRRGERQPRDGARHRRGGSGGGAGVQLMSSGAISEGTA